MTTKILILGIQTTPEEVYNKMIWTAKQWKPSFAKSFTIGFKHTNYHGHIRFSPTGYATIFVKYYSRKKNGLTKI